MLAGAPVAGAKLSAERKAAIVRALLRKAGETKRKTALTAAKRSIGAKKAAATRKRKLKEANKGLPISQQSEAAKRMWIRRANQKLRGATTPQEAARYLRMIKLAGGKVPSAAALKARLTRNFNRIGPQLPGGSALKRRMRASNLEKLTPEQRRAVMADAEKQKAWRKAWTKRVRASHLKKLTPEQRRARAKKAAQALTPAQRSARAKKAAQALTPAQRSARAKKAAATRKRNQRAAASAGLGTVAPYSKPISGAARATLRSALSKLGIPSVKWSNATNKAELIRSAFRKKALKLHPDKASGSNAKMRQLLTARSRALKAV